MKTTTADTNPFMTYRPSLTTQIIMALLLGIAVGGWYREAYPAPENIKPFVDNISLLSDIFLRLIKMIIAPLVFSLLLVGVAKLGDFNAVGRIGLKTIVWFTFATLVALSIGLIIANIFEPGKHLLITQASSVPVEPKAFNAKDFIGHVFPESIVDVMARNQILPIIIFVLFFAVATAAIHEKGKIIIEFFDSVSHVMLTHCRVRCRGSCDCKQRTWHHQRLCLHHPLLLWRVTLFRFCFPLALLHAASH
jgi:Na+/H+-dicarboxylate symporter